MRHLLAGPQDYETLYGLPMTVVLKVPACRSSQREMHNCQPVAGGQVPPEVFR